MSDHELIGFARKIHNVKHQPKIITSRNYSNCVPSQFFDDLKSANFENVFASTFVNKAWHYLSKILQYYVKKRAPLVSKKVKGRLTPWITKDVKLEMNLRDILLRKARRTDHEKDWSTCKRQRNKVTNSVKRCINRYH